jgi:hypothetical protein
VLAQSGPDRLPPADFRKLCSVLAPTDIQLCGDEDSASRLRQLRAMYEPNAQALSHYLGLALPLWMAEPREKDQWRRVARLRATPEPFLNSQHVSDRSTAVHVHDEGH